MFLESGLKDKVVLVTGGSRGIGKAIVNNFLSEDAIVYFFYHQNKTAAEEIVQAAESNGKKAFAIQLDVRDKAAVDQTVNQIFDQTQRLDVLVNNSGIVRDHLLMALSEEDIKEVIDTNIVGVFNVSQAVVPFMVSQRAGKIINISSVSGEKGGRGQANYAASKGAINAFTKALAVELAQRKITVNAVAPGVIETDISK
ncbi:MAG: SDR family NAD(P)-dependent oxidoreductase, partial [Gammaproteobacteria bacterium]